MISSVSEASLLFTVCDFELCFWRSKFVYEIRKKDGKSRKNIFGGMCSIVLLMLSAIVSAVLSLLLQSKPSPAFQTVEKSGGNICNIFP